MMHCDIVARAVKKIGDSAKEAPRVALNREHIEQRRQEAISEVIQRVGADEIDYNTAAKFVAEAIVELDSEEKNKKLKLNPLPQTTDGEKVG